MIKGFSALGGLIVIWPGRKLMGFYINHLGVFVRFSSRLVQGYSGVVAKHFRCNSIGGGAGLVAAGLK